ncbi:FAD:protein FMN transferase [Aestuariirhabdus litorea]|uniref:FAD:protein FMN transferase n=1 Tax=Aestuariirhabdus litorea TaxID=2528527 RepID=UPI001A9CE7B1|nr:FAD:protein FMN transferase [Aestuariirhabdus litorea]
MLFAQLAIAGCSFEEAPEVRAFDGHTMGTTYQVKYVADQPVQASELQAAAEQALDDVNRRMSTYREDSDLMRFNRLPAGGQAVVSADLVELVQISHYLSRISSGAYDVTVGPLVNLWGFGPDKRPTKEPSESEIEQARARIGYQYLEVGSDGVTLTKQRELFVDLSSIAKGYGVDRVAAEIEALGIQNYLVEVGGEVRMKGTKPGKVSWRIGVEKPSMGEREATLVISADNKGIATSGDYRNYFEVDGKRYSHTIDPRSGYPIDHKLVSVTVVDDSTALADGLATMFMALGPIEGMEVALREKISALFIEKAGDEFRYTSTPGFQPYVLSKPE